MKHVNTFKPDTCDCFLIFEFDDQTPDQRTPLEEFTNKLGERFVTKRCPAHVIADVQELHNQAWHGDNKRKNEALNAVLEELPAAEKTVDGEGIIRFKKTPKWSFDKDRNLVIELDSDAATKTKARAKIASKLGNRVTIK